MKELLRGMRASSIWSTTISQIDCPARGGLGSHLKFLYIFYFEKIQSDSTSTILENVQAVVQVQPIDWLFFDLDLLVRCRNN